MSDQSEMQTPEAAGSDEAVATADSPWAFSPEREQRFQELVRRYPTKYSAIMPTLWLCQEQWRWLQPGLPEWVAERLDVPVSRVYEIITFYTMYYTEDPGKYNLQVCRTASCHLMGARKIVRHIKDRLGVESNQTTDDGMFRLEEVECLGACGMAPMMLVGKDYYENLTEEKVDELLDQWRRDG